jgi:uncharacterized protein
MLDSTRPLILPPDVSAELWRKYNDLRARLASLPRVVVAYSGGVDSAFVLAVAREVCGERVRAFTARSPSLMAVELEEATALAQQLGVAHEIVDTTELDRPGYVANGLDRCYHCKSELFDATAVAAERFAGAVVVDGFNADDLHDHRPGHRAAAEHAVLHPLAECGFTKADVRALSRHLGLPTWRKPQLACLASRVPYGTEVTRERLGRVEAVEVALRQLGFHDVRARLVRDNDDMVRIEVGDAELARTVSPEVRPRLVEAARAAGFRFVTVDLEGFRSGRMNEGLVSIQRPARDQP